MKYCSTPCKGRHEYALQGRPALLREQPKGKECDYCGSPCNAMYCSHECTRLAHKKPEVEKKKAKGGFLAYCDYEEEYKKAERKRVFDENHALNFIRGKTRDRI